MKILFFVLAVLSGVYLSVLFAMYILQRRFMYRPQREIYTPHKDKSPAGMHPVTLKTSDGLTLTSWYARPKKTAEGKYFPTIFYFHGNTGIVANAAHKMAALGDAGFGVFMLEYRGYGGNEGTPSETGLITDAKAAREFVLNDLGQDARLVYYGMSMGTGVANGLAYDFAPHAMVQEAGFSSFVDAGRVIYWYFPLSLLMKDTFDSEKRIRKLTAPLLILHGQKDETIPVGQAKKILRAAGSTDKHLKIYPEGHHIDLYDFGATEDVLIWLTELFPDTKKEK